MTKKQLIATTLFILLVAGTLTAQEGRSATQVITFGVSRSTQEILRAIHFPQNPGADQVDLKTSLLQKSLAYQDTKITLSSKFPGLKEENPGGLSSSMRQASLRTESLKPGGRNDSSLQADLDTFLLENRNRNLSSTPLIVTITE